MSDVQTLIDMGFRKELAERALQVTNNAGVEPAMEWLLAHADEEILPPATGNTIAEPQTNEPESGDTTVEGASSSETETPAEAKSIKCDECNKLFRTQVEVEFHSVKSGHSNFSESTEEKKPLTEEEKKEQLKLIEEKLRESRVKREERERADALERERLRIKSGKDMTEAKKKLEELEMKKIIEQRKREKEEEKAARERVRAQIEADKAARKAKLAVETGVCEPQPLQSPATSSTTPSTTPVQSNASKEYSSTRIQVRLPDGSTLTETFNVKEQLSAVRVYIQIKQGMDNSAPFTLMTSFPRKVFTEDDYEKSLQALGLVPAAVVIATKAQ